jgi:stage V sporulation protein AC
MDNKSEGFVMGVGAKMFIVAGPVIVYGTAAGAVLGLIYYFLSC